MVSRASWRRISPPIRARATEGEAGQRPGDVLTVAAPHATMVVRVVEPGERRRDASHAAALYDRLDSPRNGPPEPGADDALEEPCEDR